MGALTKRREALIRSLTARHGRRGSEYCLCDGPRASGEILKLRPDLVEQVILREDFPRKLDFPVQPDILPVGSIKIDKVWIDDKEWTKFDAEGLTVQLPAVDYRPKVKVVIVPKN